ncbi:unnamed protein product [Amoebophrya sp. A25]|nr:unnamed protein product [Amoebophrya sp. A25]|eukprot:GSA25T00027128001.1
MAFNPPPRTVGSNATAIAALEPSGDNSSSSSSSVRYAGEGVHKSPVKHQIYTSSEDEGAGELNAGLGSSPGIGGPAVGASKVVQGKMTPQQLAQLQGESNSGASGSANMTDVDLNFSRNSLPVVADPPARLAGAISPGQRREDDDRAAAAAEREGHIESARMVAGGTVCYCAFFSLLSLIVGISDGSVALIGLAVEFALDGLTSILVLWRFKKGKARQFASQYEQADFAAKRERRRERNSGIGIGISFMLSALFLICMAIYKLSAWDDRGEHAKENTATSFYSEAIAWPCCIVFGILAAVKRQLAIELGSAVLYEGICIAFGVG